MTCPHCKGLIDVPSEVSRGVTVGVCSYCNGLVGPAAPKPKKIDNRGRPSTPGGA